MKRDLKFFFDPFHEIHRLVTIMSAVLQQR